MTGDSLYIDVYRKILRDIKTGVYAENAPLPAEKLLCERYHVSRTTVRRALALLKDSNVVYSVHGMATYIKPQIFTQPLSGFYSFTETLKRDNVLIQNNVIDYELISADHSLARCTKYPLGAKFHKLLRLRSAKEYPLMLETTYLPQSRFISVDLDQLSAGSLYDFLRERYDFCASHATECFCPVMPRPDEVALLHISPSTPCLLLERFSYEQEVLIEYTKSIIRGDKYVFRIDLANGSE